MNLGFFLAAMSASVHLETPWDRQGRRLFDAEREAREAKERDENAERRKAAAEAKRARRAEKRRKVTP
jgi:hypothetical protein